MNKHRKKKSREIRDIMRVDPWRKISYKEAKRKWRKGIRAFKVGNAWIAKDLARMGFSRNQLLEAGRAYYKILKYCAERRLGFNCHRIYNFDHYELRFNGWAADGNMYTVSYTISGDTIRRYRGSLMDIADRVLDKINHQLAEFVFPSVIKPSFDIWEGYPKCILRDWKPTNLEAVFGKIVEKGEKV